MQKRLLKIYMFETALLAAVFVFLGHAGFAPDKKPECTQTVTAPTLFKADDEPPTDSAEYVFSNDTNSKPELAVSLSFQSPLENETPDTYLISDFEVELQMPELPTGCEITALTMALNYYGCPADKVEIAERYLPTVPADLYYGDDGRLYGPDLNRYFVGDPATRGGYICGTEAIVYAANSYLADINSSLHAVDLTGSPAEDLYELVSENTPVVVWVTISMQPRRSPGGWYTEDGAYVDWSTNDHGAVLIGYTKDTVTIADPISGLTEYDRAEFEEVFASRGNRCVVIQQ